MFIAQGDKMHASSTDEQIDNRGRKQIEVSSSAGIYDGGTCDLIKREQQQRRSERIFKRC